MITTAYRPEIEYNFIQAQCINLRIVMNYTTFKRHDLKWTTVEHLTGFVLHRSIESLYKISGRVKSAGYEVNIRQNVSLLSSCEILQGFIPNSSINS